ncbi:MAG: translesion DNA synthesis-associated protein ImuA [Marinobacter sp.]|uniref:translesion DNA synthesis-associated protein ImuA n=1 Tax=Marinobacter sp. TaxID=50741 RepID=UPI00299EEAD3|nr:translesion DNA synthesis-associated protein ImuA [Marinobacter sp.]MDX1634735.1 translesion DNA synthesis-associated protein ImuA [Marinobacter sp.]
MKELLDTLIHDARVWQGNQQQARPHLPAESTGFAALDRQLQDTGWPRGALIECLMDNAGIGEFQLLLPLMRSQQAAARTVFLVNPPHTPYAPALERLGVNLSQVVIIQTNNASDALWSLENCLRSPVTGLVMAWPGVLKSRQIRRLQLAAEAGGSHCVLFRSSAAAANSSPAALRLQLTPEQDLTLAVKVLKRRGGWASQDCRLPLPERAPVRPQANARVVQGPWPERNT